MTPSTWNLTANELAARVQAGELDPADVTTEALARIEAKDGVLGAFCARRDQAALAEAQALAGRGDLAELPLAGVPVAIKDVVDVEGMATRHGSQATDPSAAVQDGEITRRLRDAGAIVIGKTRLPELAIWPFSDDADGVAKDPWDPDRSSGGSSGGSATAVAAGMATIALGSDGGGSVRIPSAACGLFGIKPGRGVLPVLEPDGEVHWFGMSHYGPIATSVADAALMLDVMAATERYRDPSPPDSPLRIAVSATPASPLGMVDDAWRDAVIATARVLHRAGHRLTGATPPYTFGDVRAFSARWIQGPGRDVAQLGLDPSELQARTRSHLKVADTAGRLMPIEVDQVSSWRERLARFFDRFDVLVTPALSTFPVASNDWRERSWAANLAAALPQAEFTGMWNLADFPAASVPAGVADNGLPVAVQIVAPEGREELVLSVAAHLEELAPWVRHAPSAA